MPVASRESLELYTKRADYVLTSDTTVEDGDSVGRTDDEQMTVHINEPVHADGLQSIQIFFDESEED